MSSLAAARADNFYIHPEWRPEFGGISKFAGSKGANQYQKYGIIRFELPFDGWCTKCERHISKGTRFNAKKEKDEKKYFTTQIWQFIMKCASCDNQIIIKTDPENNTYDYFEGIRKMEQDYEPDNSENVVGVVSSEIRELLSNDPIYRLQHENEDIKRATSNKERLDNLLDHYEATRKNDYDVNSKLRQMNRAHRKRVKELQLEGEQRGLMIPLVESNEDDLKEATEAMKRRDLKKLRHRNTKFDIKERKMMTTIQTSSIFSNKSKQSKKENKLLSSTARNHQTLQKALQKQVDRNINVKKFSLQSSLSPSSSSNNLKKRKIVEELHQSSSPPPPPPPRPAPLPSSSSVGLGLGLLEGYGSD